VSGFGKLLHPALDAEHVRLPREHFLGQDTVHLGVAVEITLA
jgi:hypothetical protein